MDILLTSDTHNEHHRYPYSIPEVDFFILAGDLSYLGKEKELQSSNEWIESIHATHKIIVPGNHDFMFQIEPQRAKALFPNCHVLIDEGIELDGFKFYGCPWTPKFQDWAFMAQRESPQLRYWMERIPSGLDFLITHGPPFGIGDFSDYSMQPHGNNLLLKQIRQTSPTYHVCGHIHQGYGIRYQDKTTFINASMCNQRYDPHNKMILLQNINPGEKSKPSSAFGEIED